MAPSKPDFTPRPVPASDPTIAPDLLSPVDFGFNATSDEREIAKNFRLHQAHHYAKATEGAIATNAIKASGEKLMHDGSDVIEETDRVRSLERSPDAQKVADKFLNHVQNKTLNHLDQANDVTVQAIKRTLADDLYGKPKPKRGWFGR